MNNKSYSNVKLNIEDLSISELNDITFDLAIFSSGYEPRCAYLYNYLSKEKVKDALILTFSEDINSKSEDYFAGYDPSHKKVYVSHGEVAAIYEYLIEKIDNIESSSLKSKIKILIDYSSMSRNWYSAILNFIFKTDPDKFEIFSVYSSAEYPISSRFLDFDLGEVRVIPGCNGSSITKRKKAVIFMLGFDNIGPQSFYNMIEPDVSYGVIAAPGSLPTYEEIALFINKSFIDHNLEKGKKLIKLPINSVRTTFESLCQLIQPLRKEYNVTIIQFGPKPHILASVLAGHIFENVSCIYSEYKRNITHEVNASGELIISKICSKV
ncbi:hypothetical protein ACPF31_002157 [Vibrio cholerae]|uniref:hypothetical protein n=3 Tax=Vibrio cholerae TaxID=666 RepID=UPI000E0C664E|nr:hypothetical protein [Vibrio cholerae]EMC2478123.1 hypothetical protein [Vibrio cholerae]MCD6643250.1 hypothetical protein [Vibrio cholerae]